MELCTLIYSPEDSDRSTVHSLDDNDKVTRSKGLTTPNIQI